MELHNWTTNKKLIQWIQEMQKLCKPASMHLCDGSLQEYEAFCKELVSKNVFIPLNPEKRPGSYWCHSDPRDVARVEQSTFICSKTKQEAGPTNQWDDPEQMRSKLLKLFQGCMEGRVMYVIPFSMGPVGSSFSQIGVEITDSLYVVVNMYITTRIGKTVLQALKDHFFVPCMHSVGVPLKPGVKDVAWPCNPDNRYIVHFPESKEIWSFGSGYGGNALLGKKCLALRIASFIGKENMWLAEHMLILSITNPQGERKYIAAAFPSSCGKTNLSMLESTLKGWKIHCVGDDIAWIKFKEDGRLYAINPEAGVFGVAPGTSEASNLYAMRTIRKNTIFTNVALTEDKDIWWEGMSKDPPSHLTDWQNKPWAKEAKTPAAHPNARFTVPLRQCPIVDPAWEDPEGVPLSAIIFGGRRATTIPLIFETFSWQHGVFVGASISSETTAAAVGEVGKLRHDPFAMLPFCGYHMGDYFQHWIEMGQQSESHLLPKIFHVNWFRKKQDGSFLWPGYGENIRVLKWIFERIQGSQEAVKTPIGYLPTLDALCLKGLTLPEESLKQLLAIDTLKYLKEVEELESYFFLFGEKLPKQIQEELFALKTRLLLEAR